MLIKNSVYRAEITSYGNDGEGVCRIENIAVFVPFSAVGDVADIKILKVLKSYAFGKIDKIITPSKNRVCPPCPVFGRCGGCGIMHLSYDEQMRLKHQKVKDCFERIAKINTEIMPVLGSEKQFFYRNKVQIPITANETGNPVSGFYRPHSHDIVPCDGCRIQPPAATQITETLLDWMREFGVAAYDETTGRGLVRHLYIRCGEATGDIMACVVITADKLPFSERLSEKMKKCGVTTLLYNVNSKQTNVVLGEKTCAVYGSAAVTDVLCGVKFEISPQSFYQVNRDQTEILYSAAMDAAALKSTDTVFDLYCGIGTMTLIAAKRAGKAVGIEIVPQAIENAKKNAGINNIENAEFYCGDAGKIMQKLCENGKTADVVIVDPPRKGCDEKTLKLLQTSGAKKIVYVSCNPSTLARDVATLAVAGYFPALVRPVDLFPHTPHVECVVCMQRKDTL